VLPPVEDEDPRVIAARHALWRRGELRWKLHATQKKLYDAMVDRRRFFALCSRRLGKSYLLVCLAFEYAIRHPNARISYAAPTMKDAVQIASDLALEILQDCPEDLRPAFANGDKEYRFPNGSVIRFSGVNAEHRENLRGRKAHLFILDEAGTMDDLKYTIQSIVAPTTATTKGKILIASTPPRSPGHDMTTVAKDMTKRGELMTFTLLDAPHIDHAEKVELLERAGENPERIDDILDGKAEPESTTALREYFCRLDVTDAETAVVPEFNQKAQAEIVIDHPRPPYFDCYVAVDPGFSDKTGIIFAYYDYLEKKLVIEDEVLLTRASTDDIAFAIKTKEQELWGGKVPMLRISDIDLRLIADLYQNHGLVFQAANRQDSLGAIDLVRTMVRRRELVIAPKCLGTVRQLRNATWNRKASDFERTQEDSHFDLLAALKYLCRAVNRNHDPYPDWYFRPGFGTSGGMRNTTQKPKTVFSDTPLGRKLSKKWDKGPFNR
jgi:hypothetical protein